MNEDYRVAFQFGLSLAIGLLIGLERERRPEAKAGVRTFPLIALLGTASALLAEQLQSPWIIAVTIGLVGASLIVAYAVDRNASADAGTTTVVAALVCFSLGAMLWKGHSGLALSLAIVTTTLLHFKTELEGFSHKLTPQDVVSTLQFAALSFVVLPLLPDVGSGPGGALNPRHIWWMVVLVSGVSWAGYVVWRLAGPQHGPALVGLLGGLVSSTATTLVFTRRAAKEPLTAPGAALAILVASLVIYFRVLVVTFAVSPAVVLTLAIPLGGALLFSIPMVALRWWSHTRAGTMDIPEFSNPANLRVALAFGAGYAIVLVAAAWASDVAGQSALYGLAFLSGLTDVDAITLSSLRLVGVGSINETTATNAIGIALLSNLLVKVAVSFALGGKAFGRRCVATFGMTATGLVTGLVIINVHS
ncbi:MAG: MgtC/SapB family protein [Burkholderiales bacterium]